MVKVDQEIFVNENVAKHTKLVNYISKFQI